MRYIIRALGRTYPEARTSLHYRNPFELLIATILSAQSTDVMVNRITPTLFKRYPNAEALAEADPRDVERVIKPTGFFRQKTKSLIGCSQTLVAEFNGEVPRTVDELTRCRGVARKTANVVLANTWPRPASDHGIFVDTHIRRVSQRLALTPNDDPVKIERDLIDLLPERTWVDVPHQMILLGRGPCNARNPRHDECPLLKWCPTGLAALAETPTPRRRGATAASRPRSTRRRPPSARGKRR